MSEPGTPPPPSGRRALATRRGFLAWGGAGLALAATSACTSGASGPVGSTPTGSGPAPSLSPDVALATLALAELRAAAEAVAGTTRAFPGLADPLAPVGAMHRTHEVALVDAVPPGAEPATGPAAYDVPAQRPEALAGLRAREVELQSRLGELALQARSGAFASLLAAMSAGTAQRVATWPA